MNTTTKIGILGGGVEGIAVAEYFSRKNFKDVTVFDEKEVMDISFPEGIKVVSGKGAFEKIYDCEVIFRSPGIHPKKLKKARQKNIKVTSTIQYFLENCACKVVGVTGTKGKGTTSTLIYLMLKEAGFDTFVGGNIGESPLSFIDKLTPESWVVLELSSFQLQDLTISPHAAVILMTTSEHLDYHLDKNEYWEAKMPILVHQDEADFAVLNSDYDYSSVFARKGRGEKLFVSRKSEQKKSEDADDFAFQKGAFLKGKQIIYSGGLKPEIVIDDVSKVALLGPHNIENVLAAVVSARKLGVDVDTIRKVVYSFSGLPHRLEFVKEVNGVKYFNDSFSTTPETSVAAVYAFNSPVILIAGGSEKNSDFMDWAMKLQANQNLKMILLMGVTADRMEMNLREAARVLAEKRHEGDIEKPDVERGIGEFPLEILHCENLQDALKIAHKNAVKGDNVVMSPAAASFDQFKNYKQRGEIFRELVGKIS